MFDRPTIGKVVTVTVDWTDYMATSTPTVQIVYGKQILTGTVVESQKHNDAATFNITTGKPTFPVATVPLHRVEVLEYADGAVPATVDSFDADGDTWSVPGSNGASYVVTRLGNTWNCECKGFMFRSACKHVNACKEEVLGRSK